MSKLSQLKNADTDRSKIIKWLIKIGETDQAIRDEVLDNCAKDIEARKYYVMRHDQDVGGIK